MITKCALGVILKRGDEVIDPTISELNAAEHDYLTRHVDELRVRRSNASAVFCAFRPESGTLRDFQAVMVADDDEMVEIATRMVRALAETMRGAPAAKEDCVVALLTSSADSGGPVEHVTFLKLDARIEAARLQRAKETGRLSLRVFQDLLPAPGDMQKGISWPDPRQPASELILHDTNQGDAALYFGNAFGLTVSSKALDTENALTDQLVAQLGQAKAQRAVALVDFEGGRADLVIAKVQEEYPEFQPTGRSLGAGGSLPGFIRPNQLSLRKKVFAADGIELRVPIGSLNAIQTEREAERTSTPLTPIEDVPK
jgi:hypothetical protein